MKIIVLEELKEVNKCGGLDYAILD